MRWARAQLDRVWLRQERKRLLERCETHRERQLALADPLAGREDDCGWVFVVCGARLHVEVLGRALSELAKFSGVPAWVVTDSRRNEIPIVARNATVVDVATPDELDHHQASIWLKTSLLKHLPSGKTWCYLDSDVVAVRPGVDLIFDELVPPVTFTLDLPIVDNNIDRFSPWAMTCSCAGHGHEMSCAHLREGLSASWNLEVPAQWVHWNGGVFLFDDHSADFFDRWHGYALAAFADPLFKTRDQHALVATVWSLGLQDHPTLSRRFNFIVDPGNNDLCFHPDRGWALAPDHEWIDAQFLHLYASPIDDPSWDLVRDLEVPTLKKAWRRGLYT